MKKLLLLVLLTSVYSYDIVVDKTIHIQTKKTQKSLIRNNQKEVVYDPNTNLLWQDNYASKSVKKTWNDAKEYCRNLSFAGYSDWRLPTIKEFLSIVDDKKYNPAIKSVFRNVKSSYYWSSSPDVSSSKGAWNVGFYDGYDNLNYKTTTNCVRCVRGGE